MELTRCYQEARQAFLTGQYDAGKPALSRAIAWAREGKDPAMAGHVLALAARWYGSMGDWDWAASMAIEARWAFEAQGEGAWTQWASALTGLAQVQIGQVQKGRTLLERSVTALEQADPSLLIDGRCWLAQALLLTDELDTARSYLRELLSGERPHGADALYRQGVIALLLASLEADAERWSAIGHAATRASEWFEELGHIPYWVSANALIGLQHAGLKEWAEAKHVFDMVVPLLQDTSYVVVDVNHIVATARDVARFASSSATN